MDCQVEQNLFINVVFASGFHNENTSIWKFYNMTNPVHQILRWTHLKTFTDNLNIISISVMMYIYIVWLYLIIFVERKEKFVIQPSCEFPESLWSIVQRNMDYLYYTIASVLEGQWLECVKSFEGLDSFGTIKNLPNQYQKITWPNFLSVIQ